MSEKYINPPTYCDLCHGLLDEFMIDGPICTGTWANLCPSCWDHNGSSNQTGASLWQWDPDKVGYYKIEDFKNN